MEIGNLHPNDNFPSIAWCPVKSHFFSPSLLIDLFPLSISTPFSQRMLWDSHFPTPHRSMPGLGQLSATQGLQHVPITSGLACWRNLVLRGGKCWARMGTQPIGSSHVHITAPWALCRVQEIRKYRLVCATGRATDMVPKSLLWPQVRKRFLTHSSRTKAFSSTLISALSILSPA